MFLSPCIEIITDFVCITGTARDFSDFLELCNHTIKQITSDGHTSLGSDDGMGIISAMYLATTDEYVHGPLRVIITINHTAGRIM